MKIALLIIVFVLLGLAVWMANLRGEIKILSMKFERGDVLIEELELLKEDYNERIEFFDSLRKEVDKIRKNQDSLRKEIEDIRRNQYAILKLLRDMRKDGAKEPKAKILL